MSLGVIETKRLVLRPLGPRDFDAIWEMAQDEDIVRMMLVWPWPPSEEFTRQRLTLEDTKTGLVSAVTLKGETIGMAGLSNGGVWYGLGKRFWGQGYGQETLAAKIEQGFADPKMDKLIAGTWHDNPVSMHILEKAGFERTGWGKAYCDGRNAVTEGPDYELTRERWERLRI